MAITRLGPNQSVNLTSNVTGTLPALLMVVQVQHQVLLMVVTKGFSSVYIKC